MNCAEIWTVNVYCHYACAMFVTTGDCALKHLKFILFQKFQTMTNAINRIKLINSVSKSLLIQVQPNFNKSTLADQNRLKPHKFNHNGR